MHDCCPICRESFFVVHTKWNVDSVCHLPLKYYWCMMTWYDMLLAENCTIYVQMVCLLGGINWWNLELHCIEHFDGKDPFVSNGLSVYFEMSWLPALSSASKACMLDEYKGAVCLSTAEGWISLDVTYVWTGGLKNTTSTTYEKTHGGHRVQHQLDW